MNRSQLEKICKEIRLGQVVSPGKALQSLLRDAGMRGPFRGTRRLSPQEAARLRDLLVLQHGVSGSMLSGKSTDEAQSSRTHELTVRRDEKARRKAIRQTVVVAPQPGRLLRMDGVDYQLPLGTTLNIRMTDAHRISVPGVILVENWEAIRDFHALRFQVPSAWRDFALVFRGMPHVSSQKHVQSFLADLGKPVVVFPDMDPAGLGMAMAVPGFAGLLWPGPVALRHLAKGRHGRQDLFEAQEAQYRARLDASDGEISSAWRVIRDARRGIVQEVFLTDPDGDG